VSGPAGVCALGAAWLALTAPMSLALPRSAGDVERGIELYWSGQYRETVTLLSALCEAENRDDVSVECYKYLAFSHVALGDGEMAQEAFSQLLARDAEYRLDESLVSPKILEQFDGSRRQLVAQLFESGKAAYFEQGYAAALELFAQVLRLDPGHSLAKEYSQLATEQLALVEKQASLTREVVAPAPPPPVEEPDDRVYHLTSRMTQPSLISRVQPDYPSAERRAGREGTVVVTAVIGKDGVVRDAKVIRSVSPALTAAAIDAVLKWRYRPAQLEGRDVAVYTLVRLDFALDP
jgi:TonB family protein